MQQFNAQRHIDTLIVQGRGGIGHKVAGEMLGKGGLVRDVACRSPRSAPPASLRRVVRLRRGPAGTPAEILCTPLLLRQVKARRFPRSRS